MQVNYVLITRAQTTYKVHPDYVEMFKGYYHPVRGWYGLGEGSPEWAAIKL